MESLPTELIARILSYCAVEYKIVRGICKIVKKTIASPYYFSICGVVHPTWLPYSDRVYARFALEKSKLFSKYILPEGYIRANVASYDTTAWIYISGYQKLSNEFIRDYAHLLDMTIVALYQDLSDEFIRELPQYFGWICSTTAETGLLHEGKTLEEYRKHVCKTLILPEKFMRRFSKYLFWDTIMKNQKLSEEFILEFESKFDWTRLYEYQLLSHDTIDKFFDRMCANRNKIQTRQFLIFIMRK